MMQENPTESPKPDQPATELERENERLLMAVAELSILNEIATAVSSTSSLEHVIELIVQKSIKHLKAEQGSITLLESTLQNKPFRTAIRCADTSKLVTPFRFDTQLSGWMIRNQKPLLVNDLASDDRFEISEEDTQPIRSILSVPLFSKGKMIGTLNLFNKRLASGFTSADERLLAIIAAQSAQVIENARLYEEEQALRAMQEEMKTAYEIQVFLLPKEAPCVSGYNIAGKSVPAMLVGGDYFDFLTMEGHDLAFCLGDVSGKGMPAALLMANLQATLRAHILQRLEPGECCRRSNTLLFRSTDVDKFATFFCGVLQSELHEVRYCNAGHNYPFLFRESGEIQRLDVGGPVLGAIEEFTYREARVAMSPGDIFLIFSDGISEATGPDEEQYGEDRLRETVLRHRGENAAALIDFILEDVKGFTRDEAQSDDMTLVVVKRES